MELRQVSDREQIRVTGIREWLVHCHASDHVKSSYLKQLFFKWRQNQATLGHGADWSHPCSAKFQRP